MRSLCCHRILAEAGIIGLLCSFLLCFCPHLLQLVSFCHLFDFSNSKCASKRETPDNIQLQFRRLLLLLLLRLLWCIWMTFISFNSVFLALATRTPVQKRKTYLDLCVCLAFPGPNHICKKMSELVLHSFFVTTSPRSFGFCCGFVVCCKRVEWRHLPQKDRPQRCNK